MEIRTVSPFMVKPTSPQAKVKNTGDQNDTATSTPSVNKHETKNDTTTSAPSASIHDPKSDTTTRTSSINKKESEDDQDTPKYALSKQLDEEAAAYKKGNATFKDSYESLEKALEMIRAMAVRLRERINQLKQSQINIKSDQPEQSRTTENSQTQKIHAGVKAYQDESTKDEVEILEEQLAEYERQEAELKLKMLSLIIEERKRLDRPMR